MFRKYAAVFSISWQLGFAYRASLVLWRARQMISTFLALTLWSVTYASGGSAFSYTRDTMITYIFLTGILQSVVLATALQGLTTTIYSGGLSIALVKPLNVFGFFWVQDLADKAKNMMFILFETAFFYVLFQPVITLPPLGAGVLFLIWVAAAVFLNFLISLLFGAFGFWSPESWGPRFLFYTLITFTSGGLFPLDILPKAIQVAVYLTPLPYLTFVETQLFMQRLTQLQVILITLGYVFWIGVLGGLVKYIWTKGLRDYTAAGQ